jgi:mutual gliding-motility protein MglA
MVFFNWATMQMAAKIVYYGPGLCGKTTNLSFIYSKTAPGSRGEMVSLETETDRTLFFDLLPLEVGKVGGFRTRLQLYTVPGQVFYNTTRKLVLKGVDGVVFVADSQRPMRDANVESYRNLEENLKELGIELADLPLVLQYNKRDLKNILSPDELGETLNTNGDREFFEAVAVRGDGVFETLKAITKTTLRSLRRRMSSQDAAPAVVGPIPAPRRAFNPAALSAAAAQALDLATTGTEPEAAPEAPAVEAVPAPAVEATELVAVPEVAAAPEELPPAEEIPEAVEAGEEEAAAEVEGTIAASEPEEEAPVEFATTAEEVAVVNEPEVRHVRVSSSLDILAELENLRKAATLRPDGPKRAISQPSFDLDSLLQSSLNSRQEVRRRVDERVGDALGRAARCRVRIELVNAAGKAITAVTPVEVELKREERLRELSLTLTVDLHGE